MILPMLIRANLFGFQEPVNFSVIFDLHQICPHFGRTGEVVQVNFVKPFQDIKIFVGAPGFFEKPGMLK